MYNKKGVFRITPAYAGKRAFELQVAAVPGDHPRVRGEKTSLSTISPGWTGSPPRTRGKAILVLLPGRVLGITPAYAGKSSAWVNSGAQVEDHPRVRGEKPAEKRVLVSRKGSPPRTRGKVKGHECRMSPTRITPAYAGKSGYPEGGRD